MTCPRAHRLLGRAWTKSQEKALGLQTSLSGRITASPSGKQDEGAAFLLPPAVSQDSEPGVDVFLSPDGKPGYSEACTFGGLRTPLFRATRGKGKPLRHHVTRLPGGLRAVRRGPASGRRAPVARKCPGSGWRRGKRGRGARRGGPGPYVAAFLPPASSPSPVSPRCGPAPSSRRPNQWLGGASLSGRGRGMRAGLGAPAPCLPPLTEEVEEEAARGERATSWGAERE